MIVHKTLGFKQTKWISPMNTIELFRYSPTMGSILGNLMFNELKHCFTIQGTIATTTINDAQEERLAIAKVTDLAISIVCMKCPVLFQCIRSIYIDKSNLKFISAIQISNHLQCEKKHLQLVACFFVRGTNATHAVLSHCSHCSSPRPLQTSGEPAQSGIRNGIIGERWI